MRKLSLISAMAVGLLAAPATALAAGAGGDVTDVSFSFEGPFGSYDKYQLQRGFQVYQQVCSGCHGLRYVAFRELGRADGPAFPEEQVKAIAAGYQVPDDSPDAMPGDTRPGKPSDKFPVNDALGAPDLSLMAKARAGFHGPMGLGINQLFKGGGGPEYIYSLLLGYTGEDKMQAGTVLYENPVFQAGNYIAMAQPLYGNDVEYTVHGAEEGEDGHSGYVPPEPTMEQEAKDVAAFLMWAAEPKMVQRKEAGFRNLIWLIVLGVLLYFTNKKLWAPIKGH